MSTPTPRSLVTADDVRNAIFTPVRLRECYDMGEVDEFLDALAAELEQPTGARTVADVAPSRFTRVRLREGYSIGEVDQLVERADATLRARGDDDARTVAGTMAPPRGTQSSPTPAAVAQESSVSRGIQAGLTVVALVSLLVIVYLLLR